MRPSLPSLPPADRLWKHNVIWRGAISGHKRANGAENLLRLIADRIEAQGGEPFHG